MARTKPFETHPHRYDHWFERHRFAYESELEAVRLHLPLERRGLEIGVGSGRFAAPLGIKFGLEPAQKMIEMARKRGICVASGVAEALPFRNASFDFALMVTTICFLDDINAAFKEVHRILKPGGSLIIGFVDKNSSLGKLYQERKADNVFYQPATFFSVEEVVSFLLNTGFKDLKFTQTIFKNLSDIRSAEPVIPGHGQGSFVVIEAGR
ncbi:MAG: methyltransferase type 11 [Planctomycetes bacterium DG_23]|nr:MAG: methyltransferase type 11 [Planctomycetes bacterium DG_23]